MHVVRSCAAPTGRTVRICPEDLLEVRPHDVGQPGGSPAHAPDPPGPQEGADSLHPARVEAGRNRPVPDQAVEEGRLRLRQPTADVVVVGHGGHHDRPAGIATTARTAASSPASSAAAGKSWSRSIRTPDGWHRSSRSPRRSSTSRLSGCACVSW